MYRNIVFNRAFFRRACLISALCRNSPSSSLPELEQFNSIIFERKFCSDKSDTNQKITLIFESKLETVTLIEAKKLAARRNFKLVKIVDLDTKTQRPVYQLITGKELFDLERKQKADEKKSTSSRKEKLLTLSNRIESHDLEAKIKLIIKWIEKQTDVRVIVTGDSREKNKTSEMVDKISNAIESKGRITQKQVSSNQARFSVVPIIAPNQDSK